MKCVMSDACVWIDYSTIRHIELPFLLPYTYLMSIDAMNDELLYPCDLRQELLQHGLVGVELNMEEFDLAESYGLQYPRLSIHDRVALAIAKARNIVLITGDRALRKSAESENVTTIGTLGILDQLLEGGYITKKVYRLCMLEFQKHNGRAVRLPESEISARLCRLR